MNPFFLLEEYEQKALSYEMSAEELHDSLKKYDIVLYGAGSAGVGFFYALKKAGISAVAFLDGNPQKKGKRLEGIEVFLPEEYPNKNNVFVIVCINTDEVNFNSALPSDLKRGKPGELFEKLKNFGYSKIEYYHSFWRCYDIFKGEEFPLPSCADVESIINNKHNICNVFKLFDEKYSKEIFLKYLEFRLIDRTVKIPTESQVQKFLESSIFNFTTAERFLDGGAFIGSTIERLAAPLNIERYVGIEPDFDIFQKLKDVIRGISIKRKEIFNNALYDCVADVPFYAFNGPGSLVYREGKNVAKAITIDSLEFEPSYIKLNIEGCEQKAILGGESTIENFSPILAIRLLKIYDFWEIPHLIASRYPNYTFFLRSYMNHLDFYLYAVPPKRLR